MRIKTIEFENFRNFKDYGQIKCSTDGKVTIIYGKNGDGKTTLHQLFQWIIYGQVRFNKTASDHLYNLAFEREQEYGKVFEVMGRLDFEHDSKQYSLTRKNTYKKGLNDSEKIAEDMSLQMMDDEYNWKRVDRPKETIEKLLPSGLSEYFFFDGESMIADLRVKGRDSASKLRKALYSMFELDVIESALGHIGRTDLKTTVLGKLYLSKGTVASGSKISVTKTNIQNAQNVITNTGNELKEAKEEKIKKQELIRTISEQIGNIKSKAEYEHQRKNLKRQRDAFLNNADNDQQHFGDTIMEMFPQLLISKSVANAKEKLQLKVGKSKLPSGLNKTLISYLLKESTSNCICGNPLSEKERNEINNYLSLLPPKSYASMYHDFTRTATQWGNGYNKEKVEGIIKRVLDNQEFAEGCDRQIKELDETERNSPDIEDLIVTRSQAEEFIIDLEQKIINLEKDLNKYHIYLNQQMKEFDKLTNENKSNQIITLKIELMQQVAEYFNNKLNKAATEYSKKLEENIQFLLDNMLTSKRKVAVSPEFAVRVTDSFNDESKSEGQFAVVSFAYIGGILKMLKSEESLNAKEYPLVLDGPFSKLDPDQRQNVINVIPQFAPQVIIFSKDDLHDVFKSENIGRIWTIVSNDEKNIARIEEGHLWR